MPSKRKSTKTYVHLSMDKKLKKKLQDEAIRKYTNLSGLMIRYAVDALAKEGIETEDLKDESRIG